MIIHHYHIKTAMFFLIFKAALSHLILNYLPHLFCFFI